MSIDIWLVYLFWIDIFHHYYLATLTNSNVKIWHLIFGVLAATMRKTIPYVIKWAKPFSVLQEAKSCHIRGHNDAWRDDKVLFDISELQNLKQTNLWGFEV